MSASSSHGQRSRQSVGNTGSCFIGSSRSGRRSHRRPSLAVFPSWGIGLQPSDRALIHARQVRQLLLGEPLSQPGPANRLTPCPGLGERVIPQEPDQGRVEPDFDPGPGLLPVPHSVAGMLRPNDPRRLPTVDGAGPAENRIPHGNVVGHP